MAESLSVKINGADVLDRQLAFRVKKEQYGMIALASATDPYIRQEEKYRMTERFLSLIHKHHFPVLIITKSDLIVRDFEILKAIDRNARHADDLTGKLNRGVVISFSFSTLDNDIAATLEPGAPSPTKRLEIMKRCKDEGFLVGINCIPTLPFISDTEEQLDQLVSAAKSAGADYALIGGLTMFGSQPADSKTLYYKFLERKFPHLVSDYKKLYKIFFYPPKNYLDDLNKRADAICARHGVRRSILEV